MTDTPNVPHLFLGDPGLTDPVIHELLDEIVPSERRAFDLEILRSPERGASDALGALMQVGMFGGGRVVWLRDYAGDAADAEPLLALLEEGLPERSTLIVSARALDGRSRFAKWFSKSGAVRDLRPATDRSGRVDPEALAGIVRARLELGGVEASESVIRAIRKRAGSNVGELAQEIDRLVLSLADSETLSEVLVEERMTDMSEGWIFDLTDAINEKRLGPARTVLQALLVAGEAPQRIVATLGTHFATLLDASRVLPLLAPDALRAHSGEFIRRHGPSLPEDFRKRHSPGRGYHLLRVASAFGRNELLAMHSSLVELDLALKGAPLSPAVYLDRFLLRACAKPRVPNTRKN